MAVKAITRPKAYHKLIHASRGTDIVLNIRVVPEVYELIESGKINYTIFYYLDCLSVGYVLCIKEWIPGRDSDEAFDEDDNPVYIPSSYTGRMKYREVTHIDWLGNYIGIMPYEKWGIVTFKNPEIVKNAK